MRLQVLRIFNPWIPGKRKPTPRSQLTTFRHSWLFFFGFVRNIFTKISDGRTDGNFSDGGRTDRRRTDGRTENFRADGRTETFRTAGRPNGRTDGRKKKRKMQSVSQTIDLVVTIPNLAESSKSELSSVTFGHFKVYKKKSQVPKEPTMSKVH